MSRLLYGNRRGRVRLIVIIAVLAALSRLDYSGLLISTPPDWHHYHERQAKVVRVIDGDTFEVLLPDRKESNRTVTRVRLWGIDTPEMERRYPDPAPAEPWAAEATAFARDLLDDSEVLLRLEPHRIRGTYGRLLAHVYLPSGENYAELLLEEGLARADDRWDHAFTGRYATVELQARRAGVGLWGDDR